MADDPVAPRPEEARDELVVLLSWEVDEPMDAAETERSARSRRGPEILIRDALLTSLRHGEEPVLALGYGEERFPFR